MKPVTVDMYSCESGDWSGLYVDGILKYEGHQIYEDNFINLIAEYRVFEGISRNYVTDEIIESLGCCFPDNLQDLLLRIEEENAS